MSNAVHHLENRNNNWVSVYDDFVPDHLKVPSMTKYIEIPCGQCIGCRLQRSREWANRMMMELKYHEKACFLTLTYNDDYLNWFEGMDPVTGEIKKYAGLVKEDLQKFIKDLRNKHRDIKIRYFACGEYGDKSSRPHYHLILFGYDPDDKRFFRSGRYGEYNYYLSNEIACLWNRGLHILSDVSWDSCAYTARYVTKKLSGEKGEQEYSGKGIIAPFVLMSTKPGLGYQYYMEHNSMFRDDIRKYYLSTDKGSISFSKPRYFKKLDEIKEIPGFIPDLTAQELFDYDKENADETYKVADDNEMQRRIITLSTDLDYYEQLMNKEYELKQRTSSLRREL